MIVTNAEYSLLFKAALYAIMDRYKITEFKITEEEYDDLYARLANSDIECILNSDGYLMQLNLKSHENT